MPNRDDFVLGLFVLLVVSSASCGSATEPGPFEPLPITRISQPGFSGLDTSQRLVIRTASGWQEAWSVLWRRVLETPPLPPVDFSREVVIIAAAGTKPTSGHFITIEAATANRVEAILTVKTIAPGNGCVVLQVLTQPVEAVRIPARDRITFEELSETRHCS